MRGGDGTVTYKRTVVNNYVYSGM